MSVPATIPIFIPSRSRYRQPTLRPLEQILPSQYRPVYIVPPADQASQYKRFEQQWVSILPRPADKPYLPDARKFIGEWCAEQGFSKFIMIDDDLTFFRRKSNEDYHLVRATGDEVSQLIFMMEDLLTVYAHVGVSPRTGNNRVAEQMKEVGRMTAFVGYQTDKFNSVEHCRVRVMEDHDVVLQLLRLGHPNLVIYRFCYDQAQTQATGGCSDWRTHEVQDQSARKLAELHPGFVGIRQKKNKTGGEFGTRTEVTIYWKKAFERRVD